MKKTIKAPLISTVSSKGQVVIPASLRESMNIDQGSMLYFTPLSNNTFSVRVIAENEQLTTSIGIQSQNKIPGLGLKKVFSPS